MKKEDLRVGQFVKHTDSIYIVQYIPLRMWVSAIDIDYNRTCALGIKSISTDFTQEELDKIKTYIEDKIYSLQEELEVINKEL